MTRDEMTQAELTQEAELTRAEELSRQAEAAMDELIAAAKLTPGRLVVVGCSTSEVTGHKIGSSSVPALGEALFAGVRAAADRAGVRIAAQCCEHLNRAVILERDALPAGADVVNVVPQPKAGGSFATAAYHGFSDPVAVEHIRADAGLDIGGTLIGMHLREVAVPVRLAQNRIGEAIVLAARTRPKFIGGVRAAYDERLL